MSDTHGVMPDAEQMPGGDVFIHAGDMMLSGKPHEVSFIRTWLATMPYRHKIVVAGNHDIALQREPAARHELGDVYYLEDSGVTIGGVHFWGSPWTPDFFPDRWAFNQTRGEVSAERWKLIPDDTNVLITHGPPHGILDTCVSIEDPHEMVHAGCEELAKRVDRLHDLRVHVFGHIHESRGIVQRNGVMFVNASSLDRMYRPYPEFLTVVDI